MVENEILRKNARIQLGNGIFEKTWLIMLLVFLIYSAIISAVASATWGIAAVILAGPLLYGTNRICINLIRGKREIQIEEMFVGFKECFTQSLLLSLMMAIYTFLWSLLFAIPGIVKSYSYAMAPYILQDSPTLDWVDCLDESKKMMKGNKWQLFCLDCSFIGWYLLGALCFGIGVLWVYPYHYVAKANFYMALKAQNEPPFTGDEATDGYESVDPFR